MICPKAYQPYLSQMNPAKSPTQKIQRLMLKAQRSASEGTRSIAIPPAQSKAQKILIYPRQTRLLMPQTLGSSQEAVILRPKSIPFGVNGVARMVKRTTIQQPTSQCQKLQCPRPTDGHQ